jgi:hypothetical protein
VTLSCNGNLMILALLVLSLIATGAAVGYGICAYLADRKASPVDPWNAPPRTAAISQVERLTAGMQREVHRRVARSRTHSGGAFWLAASAFASAASLDQCPQVIASAIATAFVILALVVHRVSALKDRRWQNSRIDRIHRVEKLLRDSLRPDREPLSPENQLKEWANNPDLRVFVMHKLDGPSVTTYQGLLVFETTGVGGWSLRAFDWGLGPVDSSSVFRGVALNLHMFECPKWSPGNGFFGASCRFTRQAFVPLRLDDGRINGLNGIVETLTIRIDDPFETMPFLDPTESTRTG